MLLHSVGEGKTAPVAASRQCDRSVLPTTLLIAERVHFCLLLKGFISAIRTETAAKKVRLHRDFDAATSLRCASAGLTTRKRAGKG
jgi:hypothetical protein